MANVKTKVALSQYVEVTHSGTGEIFKVPRGGKLILADGSELCDPTPIELPLSFKRPPTLQETIRNLMRAEDFNRALDRGGFETPAEADDFDVDDDTFDPTTPYEENFEGATHRAQDFGVVAPGPTPADRRFVEEQLALRLQRRRAADGAAPKPGDGRGPQPAASPAEPPATTQ